ncbi:DUF1499 domain-containing protein [Granulosicoccus sp.]|nr:DUF1499 domain-containing protein [Granulosicoccus sp.]
MATIKALIYKPAVVCSALFAAGCSSSLTQGPSVAAVQDSIQSAAAPESLAMCPSSPNCVSSQAVDEAKRVEAFQLNDASPADYQARLMSAVEADGGVVKDSRDGYVWATYTSSVFRFVDDIEWLYHLGFSVFDVRSASRVGHSDLGVNSKRVERLREALEK